MAPFVKETTSKCNAEYRFISGRHPATPPPGYEDYFGEGPLFRYIPFDGINAHNDTISKLSEFPTTGSPEENLRQLIESSYGSNFTKQGVKEAIVGILDVINEDPEIEVCPQVHPTLLQPGGTTSNIREGHTWILGRCHNSRVFDRGGTT